jgi:hypothetical protein
MPDVSGWWLIGWMVFSAAVQSLPEPVPGERWYGAIYKFVNLVGVNIKQTMFAKTGPVKK